jgi:alpha-glucosidase
VHAEAAYDALVALFTVSPHGGEPYGVQIAVANGGFAWRFLVPGDGKRRVTGEAACWRLPPESRVWFAARPSDWKLKADAGEGLSAPLRDLHKVSPQGPVQTLPLVAELPGGRGYAAVTEAARYRYSGLRLKACPDGALRGVFTEPGGFEVEGRFRTPWRVLLLAPTLDALVNSDVVAGLNPPPDPALFGPDNWTAGGRSVWSRWQGDADYLTVEGEKRVIDCAARLTFEFTTLDEGWESWTNAWDTLKGVCGYAATNGVRVFVWKHAKELYLPEDNYAALRTFLDRVKAAGAAGVKVHVMNGEDAGLVAFGEWVLQEAAARKLLVHFHGCQKPCGESRTYPNELKRCVEGHAGYLPLAFSRPGGTTWAHQLAMAYLETSPLLVMAEHPQRLLNEPKLAEAVPFIQALPVAWDETRVLEGSRIGEVAALARRKGDVWYVAMLNGKPNLTLVSYAPFFTGWKRVRISQLADVDGRAEAFAATACSAAGDKALIVTLAPRGGYVARLTRDE